MVALITASTFFGLLEVTSSSDSTIHSPTMQAELNICGPTLHSCRPPRNVVMTSLAHAYANRGPWSWVYNAATRGVETATMSRVYSCDQTCSVVDVKISFLHSHGTNMRVRRIKKQIDVRQWQRVQSGGTRHGETPHRLSHGANQIVIPLETTRASSPCCAPRSLLATAWTPGPHAMYDLKCMRHIVAACAKQPRPDKSVGGGWHGMIHSKTWMSHVKFAIFRHACSTVHRYRMR